MTAPREYTFDVYRGSTVYLDVPVVDGSGDPSTIDGWERDALVRVRPGGLLLHTFPDIDVELLPGNQHVRLWVPRATSLTWTWTSGWWRLIVIDPDSEDPTRPTSPRLIQGPMVVHLD